MWICVCTNHSMLCLYLLSCTFNYNYMEHPFKHMNIHEYHGKQLWSCLLAEAKQLRQFAKLWQQRCVTIKTLYSICIGVFFKDLPEPTTPCPLLSLYGIIYVTWYTSGLPEATGVRLRLPNSHAQLGVSRSWKTLLMLNNINSMQLIAYCISGLIVYPGARQPV